MAEATNHNEAGEVAPSTVDQQAPSVAEEHAPSTDSPQATDIPTANAPEPTTANPEANPNAATEKTAAQGEPVAKKPAAKAGGAAKKAAKPAEGEEAAEGKPAAKKAAAKADGEAPPAKAAKKEKPPAVEDKPFAEFIQQHYLPALKTAMEKQGVQDLDLKFEQQKIPIIGFAQAPDCWQIIGRWQGGRREFRVYFLKEDIQGQRGFSYAESGGKPSTLEPFLIDERRITLDLLVFGVVQRLNAQKWLVRN